MEALPMSEMLTVPEIARRLGCETWKVRRLYEDGTLADPPRAGLTRLIPKAELARIRRLLLARGYLTAEAGISA
jgi:excisionase family DNA binding protein